MNCVKKILFINHTSVAGGGASDDYIRMLKTLHKSKEYEITGAFPEGPRVDEFSKYCDKVFIYNGGILPVTAGKIIFYYYFLKSIFKQAKDIKQILEKDNYDLAILNVVVLVVPAVILKFKKIRTLIIIREEVKPNLIKWLLYKFLNKVTSRVIAVAQYLANDYKKVTHNKNSLVLFSAIENEEIQDRSHNFKNFVEKNFLEKLFDSDIKIITSIGNITHRKNQMLILKTIAKFKKMNLLENYRFVFIGSTSDDVGYYSDICKFVNKNNISNYCFFIGNCSKSIVYGFLQKSFAVVISSFSEGFPLVIPEAFKEKTPVITTKVGGIGDVIINEFNGLFIKNSSSDLCDKILMLNDDKLRSNIIANANESYIKYFNLEENMEKFKKYVKESI